MSNSWFMRPLRSIVIVGLTMPLNIGLHIEGCWLFNPKSNTVIADEGGLDIDEEMETSSFRKRRKKTEAEPSDSSGVIGSLGYNAFQTFGRDDSITNLELMPYLIEDDVLWFTDFRFFLSNELRYGGNIGLGFRQEITSTSFVGANLFYDFDETSEDLFHQLGFGLEALSRSWGARTNFYLPVGETEGETRLRDSNYRYSGTSIIYDLERRTNQAYRGADVELEYLLPTEFADERDVRVVGGLYHFAGDTGDDINGYKLRLQGNITDAWRTQVEYTSDDAFGNNIMLAVHYVFPQGAKRSKTTRKRNLLRNFVRRNYNIIVADGVEMDKGLSVTSSSGDVSSQGGGPAESLTVKHVYSDGTSSGTTHSGTVDDPYESIADAQASGADIILVHGGSILSESVTVESGQRIFGEGGTYRISNGTLSDFLLPAATKSQELPTLLDSPGDAFALGSDASIAGFVIDGAVGYGIYAQETKNGYASDIHILNSGGGIGLNDVEGVFDFNDITIEGTGGTAVSIRDNRANVRLDADIYDTAGYGLKIVNYGAGSIVFDDLTFGGSAGQGIFLSGIDEDLTFNQLSLMETTGSGLHIDGGAGAITFQGTTTINDATVSGMVIQNFDGEVSFQTVDVGLSQNGSGVEIKDNSGSLTFDKLTIVNENGTGLTVSDSDDVTISDGSIDTTAGTALDVENSTVDIQLSSVSSSDAQYGVRVVDTAGQLLVFGKTDNYSGGTITGAESAIFVSGSENVGFQYMLLDGNDTGVSIANSGDFFLSKTHILNVTEWGIDAVNAGLVDVRESLFESNGATEHNRIRFLADQTGSYELNLHDSILAANAGSAILVESLAGAEGSTLGVRLSGNDIYMSHSATAGLDIDWNGTASVSVLSSEFVSEDGNKTSIVYNGTSTTKLASFTIQQNFFAMNGQNDTAVNIRTEADADVLLSANYLNLNESSQFGYLLDLVDHSDVEITSNVLTSTDDSASAVVFDQIGTGSDVRFSNNNFTLDTGSALLDRGLIFESIDGTISINGQNNTIWGAGEVFNAPVDQFEGSVTINGAITEGDADTD